MEKMTFKKERQMKAKKKENEIDEGLRCIFILAKKSRRCRMLVKKGMNYCGEHSILDGNTERIVCPFDGRHSILSSELEGHLKKCNSRVKDEEYINQGTNAIKSETKFTDKIDLRPTNEEIERVVKIVDECYKTWASERIIEEQLTNDLVIDYLEKNAPLGKGKRKNLIQIASILGHIEKAQVLPTKSDECMFELGAGKGHLAYWVAKAAPNGSFVLVDRSGARNKWDNKAIQEQPSLKMKRFRCAIEHMELAKIDELAKSSKILAVCKHFCGSATDAGIRSLINSKLKFDAALLVPCCHHKSRFAEYGGHELLKKWNLDTEEAFAAVRYLSSFATNGMKQFKIEENEKNNWKENHTPTELGVKAKALLELGRAEWLNELGFETKVIEYVPSTVSPENLLILAMKKK